MSSFMYLGWVRFRAHFPAFLLIYTIKLAVYGGKGKGSRGER